jgi:membrane-associated PAP2 superfamily phosphatase
VGIAEAIATLLIRGLQVQAVMSTMLYLVLGEHFRHDRQRHLCHHLRHATVDSAVIASGLFFK